MKMEIIMGFCLMGCSRRGHEIGFGLTLFGTRFGAIGTPHPERRTETDEIFTLTGLFILVIMKMRVRLHKNY